MPPKMDFESRLRAVFNSAHNLLPAVTDQGSTVPLSESDITKLLCRGNTCRDWSAVMRSPGSILDGVENCRFSGSITLNLRGGDGTEPDLLLDSRFEDVSVGPGCRIVSAGLLRNLIIGEGVTIENCSRITFSSGSACGTGVPMELGVETGERNVPIFPLLDTGLAEELSGDEKCRENMELYMSLLEEFLKRSGSVKSGIIGAGACLTDTPAIENCRIGSHVTVSNACALRGSTLLGGTGEACCISDGSIVRDSVLQWSSRVDSMAVVERSIVGEAATVERQGLLCASFLGPNSVLAEGEVTASLAGPFTSVHHHSLLIAARWPGGKGNLGYGANVGSNHTSRLPDQEIRPGEGMFFGLGCSVKFPADYSRSPYSIIATGVTTLPQRVEFSFSLICRPFESCHGVPPAYNQIIPGWVLSDNLFSIRRNQKKYDTRNRARRWKGSSRIIREDIAVLLKDAVERLSIRDILDVYTEIDIPGLGKNFLTEQHRKKAIDIYTFHLRYFALEGLNREEDLAGLSVLRKSIIQREFSGESFEGLMRIRYEMEKVMSRRIEKSLEKDYARGCRIIDDYSVLRKED